MLYVLSCKEIQSYSEGPRVSCVHHSNILVLTRHMKNELHNMWVHPVSLQPYSQDISNVEEKTDFLMYTLIVQTEDFQQLTETEKEHTVVLIVLQREIKQLIQGLN